MSRAAAAVVALLALAAPAAAAPTLVELAGGRPLRVGLHAGSSPLVAAGPDADDLRTRTAATAPPLRATDGRPVAGFEVDLLVEAARALGVPLEIVLVDRFDDLLPGLRAGRYDVAAGALSRTLDRAKIVSFSEPYFASGLVLLVRDVSGRPPTLDALRAAHPRVAFLAGSTGAHFVERELPGAVQKPLPSSEALVRELDAPDGADVVAIDYLTARDAEVRRAGGAARARAPLEDRRFTFEQLAFAVRQGDPDWLGWLNLYLRQVRGAGTFHRIAARYNAWFRTER